MTIATSSTDAVVETETQTMRDRFVATYRELFPSLYRYIHWRVGNVALAEDLTAGVFEQALRRLATVRQPELLRPWLFTIARRAIADHFRRAHPTVDLTGVDARADLWVASPEAEAERRDALHHLFRILQELPEREREVLTLRFATQLSHREIGRILGLSEANTAQIVHRTVAHVRRRVSEEVRL